MKRPVNVDFSLDMRIIGEGKESIHASSDEGDGYDFMLIGKEPEAKHYKEWSEQLQYVVYWLKFKAGEDKNV